MKALDGKKMMLSGPVSLAGPSLRNIWLYLRRSGCHTFGMACRGDWLVSSLRFMATKASALCGALPSPPCCGCCSCALAAALRYLPSGDPESPLNTAKAVRAYLGLCCLLLPASAAFPGVRSFLFAGLRLPASPRALAVFGPCLVVLCPGRCFWPPLLCGFGLVGWRGLVFFAWVGWSGFPCVVVVSCCFLLCSCASRLLALPDVSLDWDIRIFCFHLHH